MSKALLVVSISQNTPLHHTSQHLLRIPLLSRRLNRLVQIHHARDGRERLERLHKRKLVEVTGRDDIRTGIQSQDLRDERLSLVSTNPNRNLQCALTPVTLACANRALSAPLTGGLTSPCSDVPPPLLDQCTLTV